MKILFSDLDGTIYRNKTVSSLDLQTIDEFTKKNMLIIATGRNPDTFSFFTRQYHINYSYLILCNGALIQNCDHQTISKHTFNNCDDLDRLFEILDLYHECRISLTLSFEHGSLYIPQWYPYLKKHIQVNLKFEVLAICVEVVNKSVDIIEILYDRFLHQTDFCIERNHQYIDILPHGVSKKNAIYELIEYLQCGIEDVNVIGDSFNDLSMFDINDHSFLIDNGIEELNNKAHDVVDSISSCLNMLMKK